MMKTWTVVLEGTTKDIATEKLTFEMIDHKEFSHAPIILKEDWLVAILNIAAKIEEYRVKTVLTTVLGPQQENFKDQKVLFVYALLKKNEIPLTFLLGALKEGSHMVLAIWPRQFVEIAKQYPEKELVLSSLIQIAKNSELFKFVNICGWFSKENKTFPSPYAS